MKPLRPARFKRWLRPVLDLVYPPRCAACSARLPGGQDEDFCEICTENLEPVVAPYCGVCSEPFPGNLPPDFTCPNCEGHPFAFDFAVSAWQATGPLREAIHRFKYSKRLHLRLALAHKLYDGLTDPRLAEPGCLPDAESWHIIPVPLHARRFRERTFNQSTELAKILAGLTGLPFLDALRRTRYTTSQAALNRKERLKNLAGAFTLTRKAAAALAGKNILLIDDVFTTGSTTHECAAILKSAAAVNKVIVLTVAR